MTPPLPVPKLLVKMPLGAFVSNVAPLGNWSVRWPSIKMESVARTVTLPPSPEALALVAAVMRAPDMVIMDAVRAMLPTPTEAPPGALPKSLTDAEIVPLFSIRLVASTAMLPPAPVPAALVAIVLLVSVTASAGDATPRILTAPAAPVAAPVLLLEMVPALVKFRALTFAVIVPALPLLFVLVVTVAVSRLRVGVVRTTWPALPLLVVEEVMLLPPPRLSVLPVVTMAMVPGFCGPAVAAETVDALLRVKEPAATTMSPPAPVPSAFVNRELLVRVMAVAAVPRPPRPWTVTVPAFPLAVPLLLLEISALLVRVSVPTFLVMSPARPISKVLLLI